MTGIETRFRFRGILGTPSNHEQSEPALKSLDPGTAPRVFGASSQLLSARFFKSETALAPFGQELLVRMRYLSPIASMTARRSCSFSTRAISLAPDSCPSKPRICTRSHLGDLPQRAGLQGTARTSCWEGKCGACEDTEICGASQVRVYALTGDPLTPWPCCIYQPKRGLGTGAQCGAFS